MRGRRGRVVRYTKKGGCNATQSIRYQRSEIKRNNFRVLSHSSANTMVSVDGLGPYCFVFMNLVDYKSYQSRTHHHTHDGDTRV